MLALDYFMLNFIGSAVQECANEAKIVSEMIQKSGAYMYIHKVIDGDQVAISINLILLINFFFFSLFRVSVIAHKITL